LFPALRLKGWRATVCDEARMQIRHPGFTRRLSFFP
jgi:hypothetical protein